MDMVIFPWSPQHLVQRIPCTLTADVRLSRRSKSLSMVPNLPTNRSTCPTRKEPDWRMICQLLPDLRVWEKKREGSGSGSWFEAHKKIRETRRWVLPTGVQLGVLSHEYLSAHSMCYSAVQSWSLTHGNLGMPKLKGDTFCRLQTRTIQVDYSKSQESYGRRGLETLASRSSLRDSGLCGDTASPQAEDLAMPAHNKALHARGHPVKRAKRARSPQRIGTASYDEVRHARKAFCRILTGRPKGCGRERTWEQCLSPGRMASCPLPTH